MKDLHDMTTGEAEAYRQGWEAAQDVWLRAVLRHVYRCDYGEYKGRWLVGIIGDEPVRPELAALLDAIPAEIIRELDQL